MSNFFIFTHLEKAAGTTLHYLLKYNMPNYLPLKAWHKYPNHKSTNFTVRDLKLMLKLYPMLQGIGGHTIRPHFNYENAFHNNGIIQIKEFTFLREPIERYISHYKHVQKYSQKHISLEKFSENSVHNNYIVKKFAGTYDLDKAIEVLEKQDYVGSQEEFIKSLLQMNKIIFNGELDCRFQSKNINKSTEVLKFCEINQSLKNDIFEKNELDIKLYDHYEKYIKPKYSSVVQEQEIDDFTKSLMNFKYNKLREITIKSIRVYDKLFVENVTRLLSNIGK